MKAVVWKGSLRLTGDYPVPTPGEGEALIRVLVAGICNTDMEIMKGYMGFTGIPGHEFVGVVEKTGGARPDLIGKRVVGEINCACGVCSYCLQGMKTHCPHRTTLGIAKRDGVFAEYITLPEDNLLEVPAGLSDEEAVFTEPLAAAFEITDRIHVRPTHRVLVMGDGKLGLLSAFVLKVTGARVTIVGKHEGKLEIARTRGIDSVVPGELGEERAYDLIVEATGTAGGIETALKLVKPRGTIVLKSTVADRKVIDLTPVVVDEVTVAGSRCGPFEPALRALSEGVIDVLPLVTAVFPFAKAEAAFAAALAKDALKVIIDFRENTPPSP